MSRHLPLLGLALSLVAFGYAARLPPVGVTVSLATFLAMALPGVILVRRALPDDESGLPAVVFGAAFGLALGRFGLAAGGLVFGPGPLGVVLPLAALLAGSAAAVARLGRAALPAWGEADTREARWVAGLLAALLLAVAVPYWGIGRPTPRGHAFVPYFDRDYMNHVAMAAELARGLPPENPYFAGEPLHYYWAYHLWPAAIKSLTGVPATEAVNLTIPATVGLFVAALVLWARPYVPGRAARAAAVGVGLFAFSYIGPLLLVKLVLPELADRLPMVSSREYSFLSHSWFRDCLYEPHAVTALTLLLGTLHLGRPRAESGRSPVGWLVGLGFGAVLVTDAFICLVGLLYFAATNVAGFVRDPRSRRPLLTAAAVTVSVALAAVALGVFPVGGRAVRLGLHPAAKVAPLYLLVELGPLVVLGAVGAAALAYRGEFRAWRPLLVLFALALALGFTLKVPAEANIVLRKSLKVAQVPLTAFAGAAILAAAASGRRAGWVLAGAAVTLPGLVTLGTDLALYLDAVERRYPPTTYVSPDELRLLGWVRDHTPAAAVLQLANHDRIFGEGTPLLIESLAERRTFYGNDEMPRMFQVPPPLIEGRKERVRALFAATRGDDLARALADLPPVYLYVDEGLPGPVEAVRELEARGALREVHRSGRFRLTELVRPPGPAAGR